MGAHPGVVLPGSGVCVVLSLPEHGLTIGEISTQFDNLWRERVDGNDDAGSPTPWSPKLRPTR